MLEVTQQEQKRLVLYIDQSESALQQTVRELRTEVHDLEGRERALIANINTLDEIKIHSVATPFAADSLDPRVSDHDDLTQTLWKASVTDGKQCDGNFQNQHCCVDATQNLLKYKTIQDEL